MKRFAMFAALAGCIALSACDGGTLTEPSSSTRMAILDNPDLLSPDEPYEPGEPNPPYVPPTVEYRLNYGLYRSGGDMKAYVALERGVNGYWTRVEASSLSVYCYVNGYYRDGETEHNASYTHITFGESYQYGKQIICNHSANYGQYTATTSYTM